MSITLFVGIAFVILLLAAIFVQIQDASHEIVLDDIPGDTIATRKDSSISDNVFSVWRSDRSIGELKHGKLSDSVIQSPGPYVVNRNRKGTRMSYSCDLGKDSAVLVVNTWSSKSELYWNGQKSVSMKAQSINRTRMFKSGKMCGGTIGPTSSKYELAGKIPKEWPDHLAIFYIEAVFILIDDEARKL